MTHRVVIAACMILVTCQLTAAPVAVEPLFSTAFGTMVQKWAGFDALKRALGNAEPGTVLFFDEDGNPVTTPLLDRCLILIKFDGSVAIGDSTYDYETMDEPYDIWIDSNGGVYFINSGISLPGEEKPWGGAVYFLPSERDRLVRVAGDLAAPTALIGSSDGKTLHVIQKNAKESVLYQIAPDGSLVDGVKFALEPCKRC
jgi:hypothetical protein